MENLLDKIIDIHAINRDAQRALVSKLVKTNLSKNDFLIEEGKICKRLFFVEQGAVRGFYNLDGKEVTHWFGFDTDFVTSFHSFITEKPSIEYVQALEETIVWSISKADLIQLFDDFPDIERFVRITYEKYYIRLEERYVNAQFRSAKLRYADLLDNNPQILQRIALGQIASFLGISQETLSRIRAQSY